jgi:hypothetical protein
MNTPTDDVRCTGRSSWFIWASSWFRSEPVLSQTGDSGEEGAALGVMTVGALAEMAALFPKFAQSFFSHVARHLVLRMARAQVVQLPLDTMVPRSEGCTYAANVWDSSIVHGPFSVAPSPNPKRYDAPLLHPL